MVGVLVIAALLAAQPGYAIDPKDDPKDPRNRGPGPATFAKTNAEADQIAEEFGIGRWIWTTNFTDSQECRFWRTLTLPQTNAVRKANFRITADNFYRLYLDGREIAQGANWNKLTDYDITWLMQPGIHVFAVETFNDGLEGGLILGLRIEFADGTTTQLLSDHNWRIVPNERRRWLMRTHPDQDWQQAREVGVVGQYPWWTRPPKIESPPPLRPIELHFWQMAWFLGTVLGICAVALGLSVRLGAKLAVQTRAQKLMERERMLIARDIHDDLGSALTQLVLQGEVAQTEFPQGSPARSQLDQLCDRARVVSHALEEVLWVVNSKRDTLRDFASYVCKHAQSFLGATPIRCRLDVQPDLPVTEFDLPVRRGLFLAVKEALNNAAKYSQATELFLRVHVLNELLLVVVEDNGEGFDVALTGDEGNGLGNMRQRLEEMGGECLITSEVGAGCRVEFKLPLARIAVRNVPWWRQWQSSHSREKPATRLVSPVVGGKNVSGSKA